MRGNQAIFLLFITLTLGVFVFYNKKSEAPRIPVSVPQPKALKKLPEAVSPRKIGGPRAPAAKSKSPALEVDGEPPEAAHETPEQKLDRLARAVASESFIKKVLEMEKATTFPDLKDENLIEDEVFGNTYSKKYKVKDRIINVVGGEGRYMEEVRDEKGEEYFTRALVDGQLRYLEVKMPLDDDKSVAKTEGHHSITFDQSGAVSAIHSDVDGQSFSLRFQEGRLVERLQIKNDEGLTEVVSF